MGGAEEGVGGRVGCGEAGGGWSGGGRRGWSNGWVVG